MAQRSDGHLEVYIGASRCGKTSLIWERVNSAPRVLAWDTQGQFGMYQGWEVIDNLHDLADRLEAREENAAPMKISYQSRGVAAEFNLFCRMAYAWIVQAPGIVLVEELADVTNSGKAVDGWGILTRRGLKYGPFLLAAIQRPQWCDKDTLDNSTHLAIFRQGDKAQIYLEKDIGVPAARIPTEKHTYNIRIGGAGGEWKGPFQTRQMPTPTVKKQ